MKRNVSKMLMVLAVAFIITLGSVNTAFAKESSTCIKGGCYKSRYGQSVYCKDHTWYAKETPCYVSGCTRKKQTSSSYCDYHYNQKYGNKKSTSSSSKSTSKKSSSSNTKKSYSMPDPDDYEDFDDFMDNWDGNMPDGSDAEDYWENW